MAGTDIDWTTFTLLGLGGFLLAMSANAVNQYLERDIDRLMPRTSGRPLVSGQVKPGSALVYAGLLLVLALGLLGQIHWCCALLALVAWLVYVAGYTPMKRRHGAAIHLGSVAGALPAAIGVLAYDIRLWPVALVLFLVQFVWQYPHTWVIFVKYLDQYRRAGVRIQPPRRLHFWLWVTSLGVIGGMAVAALMLGLPVGPVLAVESSFAVWLAYVLWRYGQAPVPRRLVTVLIANLLSLPMNYVALIVLKWLYA